MSAVRERVEPSERPLARTDWGQVRDVLLSIALAVLLAAALCWAAAHIARVIIIIIAAALAAYIAAPAVGYVARFLPRVAAALIVYLLFLAIIGAAGAWIVRLFVPQITELVEGLPDEIARFQQFLANEEQQFGHPGLISSQLGSLHAA